MKNVILFLVLLLMVNCTTDYPDVQDGQNTLRQETFNCVDDLPQVKITNNGTVTFEIAVYGLDYSELYTQILTTTSDTDWFELSNNEVVIVATNIGVRGKKIQLVLLPCDNIEVEIDANNALIVSSD